MPPASPANRRYVDSSSSNTPASGKAIRRRNSPQEGGAGGIGTAPLAMLAVTVVLSVMVLLQMIARDLSNDIGRCEQLKIPKHHHCVSAKSASFSEFLWQRGARRAHPLAAAVEPTVGESTGSKGSLSELDPTVFASNESGLPQPPLRGAVA
uniref:Uncharacterized protein n=2 Tax=Haptolina ericina TaxID=156174 RepID=A0A7S3AJF3_9EUKA